MPMSPPMAPGCRHRFYGPDRDTCCGTRGTPAYRTRPSGGMTHPTIAGGLFLAICCTKFQVKLSLETATVVRTSSILICNAHPYYYLAPFKTKYKRTARVAGRLTHLQASFFVQPNTPPLRYRGMTRVSFVPMSVFQRTAPCIPYMYFGTA